MGYCARDGSGDGKAHYFPRVDLGPVIDHVADANARLSLTAEGVVVSGTEVAAQSGTYTERNLNGIGRPVYVISYSGSGPAIVYDDINVRWNLLSASAAVAYHTTNGVDVARPDLGTWVASNHAFTPTVTHSPGQVTGAGYQVTQDDESNLIVHTFNGDGADADAGLWVKDAGSADFIGPYTFNGTDTYTLVVGGHNCFSGLPGTFAWRFDDDGAGYTPSGGEVTDYAWQVVTWIKGAHNSNPPPTVVRNPIASEANWSHP